VRAVAIALDGVLRKPLDVEAQDFGASLLFASLVENFRVVVLGTEDVARDEHFMAVNGMVRYVKIEPLLTSDGKGVADQKRRQIARLRREGFQFEFVVVPDPELALDLYADGVPVLAYLHPQFSNRSFRPDHEPGLTPWNELAEEVEFQLNAKAEMNRKDRV
jgi:hypothetical protein